MDVFINVFGFLAIIICLALSPLPNLEYFENDEEV